MSAVAELPVAADIEDTSEIEARENLIKKARVKVQSETRAIADEFAKLDKTLSTRIIKIGEKCHRYHEHAAAAGYTVKEARDMLLAEILIATRVDYSHEVTRSIKVYQASKVFGDEFASLPLDMQKSLSVFVIEDNGGIWGIEGKYEDQVRALYETVINPKGKKPTALELRNSLKVLRRGMPATSTQEDSAKAPKSDEPEDHLSLGSPDTIAQRKPADATIVALKTLENCEDETGAVNLLGQRFSAEQICEILAGFFLRLRNDENRAGAKEEWTIVWSAISSRLGALEEIFGSKCA